MKQLANFATKEELKKVEESVKVVQTKNEKHGVEILNIWDQLNTLKNHVN